MKFIAQFLSVLFFPLFMPLYGAVLLFSLTLFSFYPQNYIWIAYISIFVFGTVIPLTCILVLYKLKIVSSVELEKRKDRFFPYFCTSVSYFVCAWVLFHYSKMPTFVSELIISAGVALLVNAVVNIWWKISAHMTGIGAFLGGMLFVSYQFHFNPYNWILATIFACGLVAAARLYLNAHTPGQVIAGLLNGMLCTLIIPGLNLGCRLNIW